VWWVQEGKGYDGASAPLRIDDVLNGGVEGPRAPGKGAARPAMVEKGATGKCRQVGPRCQWV
jgi:hypothetical protein